MRDSDIVPARPGSLVQMLRFGVIGGSSVAIDLAVYVMLCQLSMHVSVAKAISYLAGMVFGFWGNKLWTFQSRRRSLAEPVLYLLVYAVSFVVNVGLNQLILTLLGLESRIPAFVLATGVTTVLNFVGMKWLAFRRPPAEWQTLPLKIVAPVPDAGYEAGPEEARDQRAAA